jgi:SAM-dependent methyltransferase
MSGPSPRRRASGPDPGPAPGAADREAAPSFAFLLAVGVLAGVGLAFEVLLMRLFSIVQWHHFAYMIISLALLGYGLSGTLLAVAGGWAERRFTGLWIAAALGFAAAIPLSFLAAQAVSFNPLELLWVPVQWLRLTAVYLLLMVPFLLVATVVCLAFLRHRARVGAVYGADLLGAGAGAAAVIALLELVFPEQALTVLAALGFAGAGLGAGALGRPGWAALGLAAGAVSGLLAAPGVPVQPNPFKPLEQMLQVMGTRVLTERSSPLGRLTVVETPLVPLRHVPGLSLAAPDEPPEQLAVYVDGDAMTAITRFDGRPERLRYLDYTPEAAAYRLVAERPRVLVLGAGTGAPVLRALHEGAGHVDAVELDPQVVALVREDFPSFAGGIYDRPDVTVHVSEARRFAALHPGGYELVELALLDAFNAASAGLYALNESYVYTVEALGVYLDALAPGGVLSVTRWVRVPPREGVKLFATAVAALESRGVADPGRHLAWLRGWRTATLLVSREPLGAERIAALRAFARERSFDLAWLPGMSAQEANRFNRLAAPWFHEAALAILGPERERFLQRYRFEVRPATDDRPYFYRFFRWNLLPEMLRLRAQGSTFLQETGYLVLAATVVQAGFVAALLLGLPLWLGRRRAGPAGWRVPVYFFGVGVAFMFVEIAAIQVFARFLAHPLYAVAVVLAAFLVFAGLGAWTAGRAPPRGRRRMAGFAVLGIALWLAAAVLALDAVFDAGHGWSDAARVAVTVALVAPLAFVMGLPFTLGLAAVSGSGGPATAWAWAANGFASVLGATLATWAAVHLGLAETGVRDTMAEGRRVLGAIPGVRGVTTGEALRENPRYRYAWLIRFAHPAVIASYREHPDHVAFADTRFRPVAADRVSMDYRAVED